MGSFFKFGQSTPEIFDAIFYQLFIFAPNDSPLKTKKNLFHLKRSFCS